MSIIDRSVLIQIANECFARVVYLAATSKPGCKVARKHLREASKYGLDAKAFVEADVVTGDTWRETAPPIRLPRDSKAAALRAIRDAGYRVMHKGGELAVYHGSCMEFVNYHCENPEVARVTNRIGADIQAEMGGPTDIAAYKISVYPKR